MLWKMLMKEVLISRMNGIPNITPTDMDGTVHHSMTPAPDIDVILVYYGSITMHIVDGNVCFRGHRLRINVDIVRGRLNCLVVKITDTSGEEDVRCS